MIHLSAWLQSRRLGADAAGILLVEQFLNDQHAASRFVNWRVGGFDALLQYLGENDVPVATALAAQRSPVDEVLDRFAEYQATERGLSKRTIDRDRRALEPFVTAVLPDLAQLTPAQVTAFVVEQAECNPRSLPHLVSPLRTLLRFLHVAGLTLEADLAAAVPSLARWKLAGLPKALPPEQVTTLMSSCDQIPKTGQRDRAILMVLARLGLRIGEVARLRLDDVDWPAGELVVTGKGPLSDRLPLPTPSISRASTCFATRCPPGRPRPWSSAATPTPGPGPRNRM
jgi:integrase